MLSRELRGLADKIFIGDVERIRKATTVKLEQSRKDTVRRGLSGSGISLRNKLDVYEEELRELSQARAESYLTVLKQANLRLDHQDIDTIISGIREIMGARIGSVVHELELQAKRINEHVGSNWARANLDRAQASVIATTTRNLEIERQMRALAAQVQSSADGNFAFIIMSFNPRLEFLYRDAFIPALTKCGLQPYRVDTEEFEGTINQTILAKIRESRIVLADLTEERPNCYFELGYAIGIGKPILASARRDHDPRRDYRMPGDPKVHFDLDSHKISFWETEKMNEHCDALVARITKLLAK